MGFMGLDSWVESDNAADFRFTLIGEFLDKCAKELDNDANEYNTPGFINVALVIEAGCLDCLEDYEFEDYEKLLFQRLVKKLERAIKEWGPEHKPDIKRMLKSVKTFCKKKNIQLK